MGRTRDALRKLVQLQDQITHLNEAGQTDTPRFRGLKGRRDALMDKIASHVEALEDCNGHDTKEVFEL